jgi:hypothetical protein
MATTPEQRTAAGLAARRLEHARHHLDLAAFHARQLKLPRATRVDKLLTDTTLLRDFFTKLAKNV